MTKKVINVAGSVRARLLNLARARNIDFQLVLHRYSAERFLYRLGISPHRDRFVLKGAMLFVLWDHTTARSTRDVDLAGYWANDPDSLAVAFREICAIDCEDDGLELRSETLRVEPIRADGEYHGFRVQLEIVLARATIPFQVDVGFGDAIVPAVVEVAYPTMLDAAAPQVRAYPREAVIAEKLHAMVTLGERNSRFKDFFDVHVISDRYAFDGATLTAAISATFGRRGSSPLEPWPAALSSAFYEERARAEQWRRFLERTRLAAEAPGDFTMVGERVRTFLDAPLRAMHDGETYRAAWPAGGPWQ